VVVNGKGKGLAMGGGEIDAAWRRTWNAVRIGMEHAEGGGGRQKSLMAVWYHCKK